MSTISIFCIGTGHTKEEENQTMVQLYDACTDRLKYINDGPHGGLGLKSAVGWGMNTMFNDTFQYILKNRRGWTPLTSRGTAGGPSLPYARLRNFDAERNCEHQC